MGFLNGNVLRRPHLSLRREWHTLLAATIGTLLTCFAVVALTRGRQQLVRASLL